MLKNSDESFPVTENVGECSLCGTIYDKSQKIQNEKVPVAMTTPSTGEQVTQR